MRLSLIAALIAMGVISAQKVATSGASRSSGRKEGKPLRSGFVQRVIRELKSSFVSDLEAVTLQLTRPSDQPVPRKSLEELVNLLQTEYVDPEFLVTLLAKLSRKMTEPSIYTKLKAMYTLHQLMILSSDEARRAIRICVQILKDVYDEKVEDLFFSTKTVESFPEPPDASEAMIAKFAMEYFKHVLDLINVEGDASNSRELTVEQAASLRSLLHEGVNFVELNKAVESKDTPRQCVEALSAERKWILKKLASLYEAGIPDERLEADVLKDLLQFEVEYAMNGIEVRLYGRKTFGFDDILRASYESII